MKQSNSKGAEAKKQSQASGVQINSNLGSGRPPVASKGSERGTSASKRKGGSGVTSGPERSPRHNKNSIASEKVGKSSAERRYVSNVGIGSGQSNSRKSVGVKPSGEQPAYARTTDSGGLSSGHEKLNSVGDKAFDIQMDQLHVVG